MRKEDLWLGEEKRENMTEVPRCTAYLSTIEIGELAPKREERWKLR